MTKPLDRDKLETVYDGRFIKVLKCGRWEYVTRANATGVIVIVPIIENKLVLAEQFRAPVNQRVLELPAGLVGDEVKGEALITAARRELLEETGYEAGEWRMLAAGYASPGLTDEAMTYFLAKDLKLVSGGGGVDGEDITIHEVPLDELDDWLVVQMEMGKVIDNKLLAGLYLARRHL